ncbi:MAG: hypothetical protein KGL15_07745 [Acidobacteriota bacterium]|nr:hypothetical protein [Acidobacteriota bacterium]
MRELELIAELRSLLANTDPHVVRGPGDDAAVVRGSGYAVTSVDTMVEDVHFRRAQLSAAEIGHRALAAALSDLAAMGLPGGQAYLALGLPRGYELGEARALVAGAAALAQRLGVTIAGGDVTAAPALIVAFTVVGWTDDETRTPPVSWYYVRVIQDDGELAWGSPMWVHRRPAQTGE